MLSVLVMSRTDPVILDDFSGEDDSEPDEEITQILHDSPIVISDDSDLDNTNNLIPTILTDSPVKVVKSKRCRRIVAKMDTINIPGIIKEENDDGPTETSSSEKVICMPSKKLKREFTFNNGNQNQPIFDRHPTKYLAEDIINMLLDPKLDSALICFEKPSSVLHSAAFIVDLTLLSDADDIKRDCYGKWNYTGSRNQLYFIKYLPGGGQMRIEKREPGVTGDNIYQIRRLYCKHPSNDEFRRLIATITDCKGNPHHLCLLVYYLPDGFEPVIAAHGNSKDKSKEFHTTWSSTKKMIASTALTHGVKSTVSKVHSNMGGILSSKCPGQLPRSERQIFHIKRSIKASTSPDLNDELYTIMFRALNEETAFVRQIKVLPEPAIILASDYQLHDIQRFCTDPSSNCVLTIDPTFSLGSFDVTPTTYRHLLVESHRYHTFPVCIGPILIHYKKSFSTYHFFASSLVGLNRNISRLVAFGTDGELALSEGFSSVFPGAVHLLCTIHARRNVVDKMKDLKLSDSLSTSILNDTFGIRNSDTYIEGLIDAIDDADFAGRFYKLEKSWSTQEKSDAGTNHFVPWFKQYKLNQVKNTMIVSVRKAAGLPPTEHFSTNASEAVNMILKSKMNYKKSDLPHLVTQLKELVHEQSQELDNALLNRGKFLIKSSYEDLVIRESVWHKMSEQQRLTHLQLFHNTTPIPQSLEPPVSSSCSSPYKSLNPSQLSVSSSFACKYTSISQDVIVAIWTKAAELIATQGAIAEAPGCSPLARNIVSRSKGGFHTVKRYRYYRFICDCPHFSSIKICAHSVATAEVNNLLQNFVESFKPARPNITKLVTGDMPKGRGKKGTKTPKKRTSLPSITDIINPFNSDEIPPNVSLNMTSSSSPVGTVAKNVSQIIPPIVNPLPPVSNPFSPSSYYPPSPSSYMSLYPPHYPPPYDYPSYQPNLPSMHRLTDRNIGQFNIVFIQGNISVCRGCSNKYVKPPVPPNDICLQHLEWREFIPQGSQTPRSKWGNVYYHCHLGCVLAKWPSFAISNLSVDPSIAEKFLPVHKSHVYNTLGLHLQ